MKYLSLLLLLPALSAAGELELACNLERSKTEVQASTLDAPEAIGSVGQDATTGTKSAILGVRQSFSGKYQADLLRQAAEAKCDALRSTLKLDEHARWSQLQVTREGLKAELAIIEQAIAMAKTNISFLDAQLSEKVITILQHTEARQSLVSLEIRQAALLRGLSDNVLSSPDSNAAGLMEAARTAEAHAAGLTAEAAAQKGWDIVVSAGGRQPESGNATPFASIGFSWSFGAGRAEAAAQDVRRQTEQLLAVQQGGYAQTLIRQKETISSLIQAETMAAATSARQMQHLREVREPMVLIDTALANNTVRSLNLQLKILEADRIGAETRLTGYKALLDKLQ
jgi:hypothetical protein